MNPSNNVLRAAIAACFSVASTQADAVLNMSLATPTGAVKVAKEIPSTTTTLVNAANHFDIKVKVPENFSASSSNPVYVKLNLTSGARFVSNPSSFRCGTAAAANSLSGILQAGGAGTSYVTYMVETGTISGTCSATNGNLGISGLSNIDVSATIEYRNGLVEIASGLSTNLVTYVTGMVASITSADGNVIVDATTGSIHLSPASNKGTTGLATLGRAQYTRVGTSAVSAGMANNVSAGDVITTGSVTVNGPAIAAALAANGVSGIFLDAVASACTTRSYTIDTTAINSVTFARVSLTDISAGVSICLNVSGGSTVISTGQLTATVGGTPVSSVTADFTTLSNALETLTSNGVTKNAYLINASTSTDKTTVLRIINTGGNPSTLTATAYDEAGNVIGTANAPLGAIAIDQMLTFTSAQLESALGISGLSPTAKYRIAISGGLAAFKVLLYTVDVASGSLTLTQALDD